MTFLFNGYENDSKFLNYYIKIVYLVTSTNHTSQKQKVLETKAMHYYWCSECEEPTSSTHVPIQTHTKVLERHVLDVFSHVQLLSMSHNHLTHLFHSKVAIIPLNTTVLSIKTYSFCCIIIQLCLHVGWGRELARFYSKLYFILSS